MRAFGNSMLMAGVSTVIAVLVCPAAYALSRRRSKAHNRVYLLLLHGANSTPVPVTTLFTLKFLHLQNTYLGIILDRPNPGNSIPLCLWIFR